MAPAIISGSAGRLVVTYIDGSWTDNLAIERYVIEPGSGELTLSIDLAARVRPGKVKLSRQALRELVAKLGRIHTIQIGKPRFMAQLRGQLRVLEHSHLGVRLHADGHSAAYPAGITFDPDAITLNLG